MSLQGYCCLVGSNVFAGILLFSSNVFAAAMSLQGYCCLVGSNVIAGILLFSRQQCLCRDIVVW